MGRPRKAGVPLSNANFWIPWSSLLSYHSDFFRGLFESPLNKKGQTEFPIQEVKFEHLATLLSLIQDNPIKPNANDLRALLALVDRFLIPTVKRQLDLMIPHVADLRKESAKYIKLADEFDLEHTLNTAISFMNRYEMENNKKLFKNASDKTKLALFNRYVEL